MYLFMEQSMVQAMVQDFDIVLHESMTVTFTLTSFTLCIFNLVC